MKLIFALGNPSTEYSGTRHNIGFEVIDAFARSNSAAFTEKSKFKAFIAEVSVEDEKVLLAKPTTFYNLVGESYRSLIDFYKIVPENTLVIHDELALPFGTLRSRVGGSDAGNNGIKSINLHGGDQSARLRIGISNELRSHIEDTDFVLGKLSKSENEQFIDTISPNTMTVIANFITGAHEPTSHRLLDK